MKNQTINRDQTRIVDLFRDFDVVTERREVAGIEIDYIVGEFWTARQRQSNRLQEISYRGCFKAELPRFFIERFSAPGDLVYDCFSGRGTTAMEAALNGREAAANDINPLSGILLCPRLTPPSTKEVSERLASIPINDQAAADIDLSMFYHRKTEAELVSLRNYLRDRKSSGAEDEIDRWIRMVATNRLTGHSNGFFSVYTLPPNQAASQSRQKKINADRNQAPEYRPVFERIIKKTKVLVGQLDEKIIEQLRDIGSRAKIITEDARRVDRFADASVTLTVTSPPFLNNVQYAADNWLRCWFNSIDAEAIGKKMSVVSGVKPWFEVMSGVFTNLFGLTKPGGFVAFEVGEVNRGKIKLEKFALPAALKAGFEPLAIMINQQEFTKTSNIWGVSNNSSGTNSNRIVLVRKPAA